MSIDNAVVWFRRDLRTVDHAALYHALKAARRVHCVFIFDTTILAALPSRCDRRVEFIREALVELDAELGRIGRAAGGAGGGLIVRVGNPVELIPQLVAELAAGAVFVNRDYEPVAKARDAEVAVRLRADGVEFAEFKDLVIFDRDELRTQAGNPFSVFTPYRHAWLKHLSLFQLQAYPVERYAAALMPPPTGGEIPTLGDLGFGPTDLDKLGVRPGERGAQQRFAAFLERIDSYANAREFPALNGTSGLSVHLRFGTISIRQLASEARRRWEHEFSEGAGVWLSELIWRDFYFMILDHHPRVVNACFRPEFDRLVWDESPQDFAAWCAGRTGYPLVDAAMRQLNQTGYMHNRLRMLVVSFLTKDLGIDWRRGERYFADTLLDYDLAANNGGWQWAASTGCDAQPYFRVFNPVNQSRKFDPEGRFIRMYCPELAAVANGAIHAPWTLSPIEQRECAVAIGRDYPTPIVDHATARARTLERFKAVRAG